MGPFGADFLGPLTASFTTSFTASFTISSVMEPWTVNSGIDEAAMMDTTMQGNLNNSTNLREPPRTKV